jgi:serine/threonine protein kinase
MALSGMEEIFDGRFRIQKRIGSGSFSVVFCVLDSDDNRRYGYFFNFLFFNFVSFIIFLKESIKNHQKKQSYKRRV